MPKGRAHASVPKFTIDQLALAEVCAIALWQGIDYQTGVAGVTSDEQLLANFANPTDAMRLNPRTRQNILELDIRELIKVAKLKALYRSNHPTDFGKGIAAYRKTIVPTYGKARKKTLKLANPYDFATRATLEWSAKFVDNQLPSLNGNYRVALACRILFFAMPDMMIFNFSNALAKEMNLQSRPQAAIPNFNRILFQGLQTNETLLKHLKMPTSRLLNTTIWKAAKKNGWWNRRVIDLALLLHYGIVNAAPQFQSDAISRAKAWRKKNK